MVIIYKIISLKPRAVVSLTARNQGTLSHSLRMGKFVERFEDFKKKKKNECLLSFKQKEGKFQNGQDFRGFTILTFDLSTLIYQHDASSHITLLRCHNFNILVRWLVMRQPVVWQRVVWQRVVQRSVSATTRFVKSDGELNEVVFAGSVLCDRVTVCCAKF